MTRQCGDLLHGRVFPDIDLVLAVAVGRHEFVHILCEHEVAYLAARLDGFYILQLYGVPELNSSILSATAGGQESLFVRGPCDGFDSCLMLVKLR